jgi:hypothetical protein
MESGIIMTINSCRDRANFTEQMITEGAVLYTKTIKPLVSCGHMLTLTLYEKVRYNA